MRFVFFVSVFLSAVHENALVCTAHRSETGDALPGGSCAVRHQDKLIQRAHQQGRHLLLHGSAPRGCGHAPWCVAAAAARSRSRHSTALRGASLQPFSAAGHRSASWGCFPPESLFVNSVNNSLLSMTSLH